MTSLVLNNWAQNIELGHIKQKMCKTQFRFILRMHKISFGIYSHICAVWSGPLPSAHAPKALFCLEWLSSVCMIVIIHWKFPDRSIWKWLYMRMCVLVRPFQLRFQLLTTSLFATLPTRLRFVLVNSRWRFTFAINIVNSFWQFSLVIRVYHYYCFLLLSLFIRVSKVCVHYLYILHAG